MAVPATVMSLTRDGLHGESLMDLKLRSAGTEDQQASCHLLFRE